MDFTLKAYDTNIFTPVIRAQVRQQKVENRGHYTVYLPAYSDKRILKVLRRCSSVQWQVFSKHNEKTIREKNVTIQPINNDDFVQSMATAAGVLCGAGFETPAEALYLQKKLLVIPMKGQYEQQCNAAALKEMGVPVLKKLRLKNVEKINKWLADDSRVEVDYPDITEEVVNRLLQEQRTSELNSAGSKEEVYPMKKFRQGVLKKIVAQL